MQTSVAHRSILTAAALAALAAGSPADVDRTALASRYADFQRQQTRKWALASAAGSLTGSLGLSGVTSTVSTVVDRFVRYQVRLMTGRINPTNSAMFGSDLTGQQLRVDAQIGITDAHATATGRDVVVAVLDGGFNVNHPAISARVLPYRYDAVQHDWNPQDRGNGVDDDQDGVTDLGVGHGTFVAGMILSVAPDAWILPVQIADDEGYGLEEELVSGIDFAIAMGADVINISFEAGTLSPTVCDKLHEANSQGIVVVVSAGNDGSERVKSMAEDGTTISVGAVDCSDEIAWFSNAPSDGRGLTLFAPGVDLFGPHGGPSNDCWCTWSGTSFSAPLSAGAVALALEAHPGLTPLQVRDRLRAASTSPVRRSDGTTYPYAGRIDLRRLVTQ